MFVDDAHWADAASLGVVAHIAHRVAGIPVALIVASREAVPGLESTLRVAPLGEDAAAVLVRAVAPRADDARVPGVPRRHGRQSVPPARAGALAGRRRRAPSIAWPSRARSGSRARSRLGWRRCPRTRGRWRERPRCSATASRCGSAAGLAEIELETASDAADALVAAGVLRTAHPLAFLHPLIGAAVSAGMGPAARARDHGRAARLLADEGESPERVAAQLLRCPPAGDPWAFERLAAAARQAGARGAADAVATYLLRALEEPPPPGRRADVLLDLGSAECQFDPNAAIAHLREALAGEIAVERRYRGDDAAGRRARPPRACERGGGRYRGAVRRALTERPDLRGPTEAALSNITRIDPTTRRRADAVIERMRKRVDEGERDPSVLGTIAAEMGMFGEPADPASELAEIALLGMEPTAATAAGWSWYNAVRTLVVGERYDVALRALDDEMERARSRGAPIDIGGVLTFRSELFVHTGDLGNAEVDARTLHEIADGYGWVLGLGTAMWVLGEVLIERGELDEAEALLFGGAFEGSAAAVPHVYSNVWVLRARALLRQALGQSAEAVGGIAGMRAPGDRARPHQPRGPGVALAARARADGPRRDGRGALAGDRRARPRARVRRAAVDRDRAARGGTDRRWPGGDPAAARGVDGARGVGGAAGAGTRQFGARVRAAPRAAMPRARATLCAARSISPIAVALRFWRRRRWPNCGPPARGRGDASRVAPAL